MARKNSEKAVTAAGRGRGAAGGRGEGASGGEGGGGVRMIVVLGDQLDHASVALAAGDAARDVVVMMEVKEESAHVPSHAQRTVVFLSAMRHFAEELRGRGWRVWYSKLNDPSNTGTLSGEVTRAAAEIRPAKIVVVHPGEQRVLAMVKGWGRGAGVDVELVEDTHFLTPLGWFEAYAAEKKSLVMEFFYRQQRKRLGILVDEEGNPTGGAWNFDAENREAFGKAGPQAPPPVRFEADSITRGVIEDVKKALPGAPGLAWVDGFSWAVTRAQGLEMLEDFVAHRLRDFGRFEDAMWTGQVWLYHSQLSVPLNLKLISPRECVEAALREHTRRPVPLNSLEGFIRQIIGWREFIRGVYWTQGPGYGERNGLEQYGKLPWFYWSGETDMRCVRECVGQVLKHAYSHHIPRLMVLGNFALIAGVHPREMTDWFLAMYADAVDWVTTPNTLGMAMHADGTAERGPVVGTKPYAASGKYIDRMSNYCGKCSYDVGTRTGEKACPFNTLYWDFLIRNRERFSKNQRMAMILKNVDRMKRDEMVEITVSAGKLREKMGVGEIRRP